MTTRPLNIPSLSSKVPVEIRRAFDAFNSYFKTNSFIAQQDMVESGLLNNAGELALPSGYLDLTVPPKITGFGVTGAFNTIILGWNEVAASNIAYVEVWRNTEDALGTALRIGTTSATVYADSPPNSSLSVTYYYWVRAVNFAGAVGPWNGTAGTPASTANDPAYVLEVLSKKITEGQLYQDLNSRINLIDTAETGLVPRMNVAETSIQQKAEVSALNAVYEIKFDIDGRVTGFGAVADAEATEFGINADRFWIADPDGSGVLMPFVVDNGKVYMDVASIKDATIKSAKIESVAADKIVALKLSAIVAALGDITSGTITMSNVASWIKSSNYSAGNSGFLVRGDGFAEFQNIFARGNVEATSLKSDTLMVKSGNIHDLVVETQHIGGNAVTVPVSAVAGAVYLSSTPIAVVTAPSTDFKGAPVNISGSVVMYDQVGYGATVEAYAALYRDGVKIWGEFMVWKFYNSNTNSPAYNGYTVSISFKDIGVAGSHTYSIRMRGAGASQSATLVCMGVRK